MKIEEALPVTLFSFGAKRMSLSNKLQLFLRNSCNLGMICAARGQLRNNAIYIVT